MYLPYEYAMYANLIPLRPMDVDDPPLDIQTPDLSVPITQSQQLHLAATAPHVSKTPETEELEAPADAAEWFHELFNITWNRDLGNKYCELMKTLIHVTAGSQ